MSKKEVHNPIIDAAGEKSENENHEKAMKDGFTGEKPENILPDAASTEETLLAKLELELSASRDQNLRLFAEFDNYKKRVARERIEFSKMAGEDFMLSILPVLDDFERALKSLDNQEKGEVYKAGVLLIYQKLKAIVEGKGLKEMKSTGEVFDPEIHDAISNAPAPSEMMKGKVVDEIEKGYFLYDKVIRHAKVIVGN